MHVNKTNILLWRINMKYEIWIWRKDCFKCYLPTAYFLFEFAEKWFEVCRRLTIGGALQSSLHASLEVLRSAIQVLSPTLQQKLPQRKEEYMKNLNSKTDITRDTGDLSCWHREKIRRKYDILVSGGHNFKDIPWYEWGNSKKVLYIVLQNGGTA